MQILFNIKQKRTISFFLLIFFFNVASSLSAQEYEQIDKTNYIGYYTYEYQEDSSSLVSRKTQEMCLYLGQAHSKFEHSGKALKDSLLYKYRNEDQEKVALKIMPILMNNRSSFFTKYSIVKTRDEQAITELYETISNTNLNVQEKLVFNWQLINTPDTTICTFPCKKATVHYAGRIYTAWYTLKIPISDGPYKFKGLPGLIVKIEDQQAQHVFELTSFQAVNYEKPMLKPIANYQTISAEAYNKAKKADLMAQMKKYLNPNRVSGNSDDLARMEARMKGVNNYIERY